MNDFQHRAHPEARRVVLEALSHYRHGLTMTELRRRTTRGGLVIGARVVEELSAVLEDLLDDGDVEQVLVGRGIRYTLGEQP